MSIGLPGRIGLLRTIIWVMASLAGKQKELPRPKKQPARRPVGPRPALHSGGLEICEKQPSF